MCALVEAEVDAVAGNRRRRDERLDDLLVRADERQHAAVVVGVGVDVEQPRPFGHGSASASIVARSRPSEKLGTASSGSTTVL